MNREFKFRIWDTQQKKFVTGYESVYSALFEEVYSDPPGIFFAGIKYIQNNELYVVQQYTGFKDINAIEVYEGDIVEYHSGYPNRSDESFDKSINVVRYEDGAFWPRPITEYCDDDWYTYKLTDIKVIGNIFENPELLK